MPQGSCLAYGWGPGPWNVTDETFIEKASMGSGLYPWRPGHPTTGGPIVTAPPPRRFARSGGRRIWEADSSAPRPTTLRSRCWCGSEEVTVPRDAVREGRTVSCGAEDCNENNREPRPEPPQPSHFRPQRHVRRNLVIMLDVILRQPPEAFWGLDIFDATSVSRPTAYRRVERLKRDGWLVVRSTRPIGPNGWPRSAYTLTELGRVMADILVDTHFDMLDRE